VPAAGRGPGGRARGLSLLGRGTRALDAEMPHWIAGVLIRMAAEPA